MTDIEDAPCERCGKPVHLQHDAPCNCGTVTCPDCPPCSTCFGPPCKEEGCMGSIVARGWCSVHYSRWNRGVEVSGPRLRVRPYAGNGPPPIKVDESGCWEWGGAITSGGYGRLFVDGKPTSAHRWMYKREVGPIPQGLQLDHLCRNRACVNPAHLEPVSSRENSIRGEHPNWVAHRENRCTKGHEFTPENTYVDPKRGTRRCRACHAKDARDYRARRSA